MVVNIPEIKSMWVGQSEKNIQDVFDRYRQAVQRSEKAPILLFNEADGILGIRQEVAHDLCMGYSNFRRIFKEYTGLSPAKYIQQVRMGKVKEALTNSSRPVKEIAFEMGYENEDYFFTAFRRQTGMTPQEYRAFTQGRR